MVVVVDLLFNVLIIACGGFLFVFVMLCISFCQYKFCKEVEAGCFAIIVLQIYCFFECSVALSHGAVGRSAVCDCGTS